MKIALNFSLLLFSGFIFCQEPGMKIDDFKKKFPGIVPEKTEYNESIARQEQIGGFDGSWYFSFLHSKLDNVFFSTNLGGAPEQKFAAAFTNLKNSFIKTYGKPISDIIRDTLLNVDREKVNTKDTLMVARWQMKECEVELGLFYAGNKNKKQSVQELVNQQNAMSPMNYYIFTINCFGKADPNVKSNWKFYPGLTPLQLMAAKPEFFPDGVGVSGQWQKEETLNGLKGKWSYDFKNNFLDWCSWNYQAKDTKENSFNECVKETKKIIAQYTKKYGKPTKMTEDIKYKDPFKEMHYGYSVIKAEWRLSNNTITVSNHFNGAKGNYFLGVSIEKKRK